MPDNLVEDHKRGVRAALAAGWAVLERGGRALDAVEEAVAVLEDDETFDAGRGSFLTRDGRVQLDALLMDGATLRAGGVGCVERIKNPIRLSRLILDKSPHIYFVGQGAERFAVEHGMALIDNSELVVEREREMLQVAQERERRGEPDPTFAGPQASAERPAEVDSHDTVGAVALDADGDLAAATSTGGTLNKAPGRVGDSSLIGCGCYADNGSGAVSCTGWGEPMMKLVLGKWATDRVAGGDTPQQAAEDAIAYVSRRLHGHGGMILLDAQGRFGIAHNTKRMAWGVINQVHSRVDIEA